jgi:hypothetical protein
MVNVDILVEPFEKPWFLVASYTKNGHSPKFQFRWNPGEVPSPICKDIIFSMLLLLALTIVMDAHELGIVVDWTKWLEKENGELEVKLHS